MSVSQPVYAFPSTRNIQLLPLEVQVPSEASWETLKDFLDLFLEAALVTFGYGVGVAWGISTGVTVREISSETRVSASESGLICDGRAEERVKIPLMQIHRKTAMTVSRRLVCGEWPDIKCLLYFYYSTT